jgi:hypothetical protein
MNNGAHHASREQDLVDVANMPRVLQVGDRTPFEVGVLVGLAHRDQPAVAGHDVRTEDDT